MIAGLKQRIHDGVAGRPLAPLAVLFILNALDEVDRGAFGALAPEIRNAFSLTNEQFGALVALALPATLLGSLPFGALADRFSRKKINGAVALVWVGFALMTAVAPVVWVLAIARAGSGVAQAASGPVHRSMLADVYPAHTRSKVFSWHQVANPVGLVIGPLIGAVLVAPIWGWRAAFVVLALPMVFAAIAVFRLREPARGEADALDPENGPSTAPTNVSVREAFQVLRRMGTIRRLWYTFACVGAGALALAPLLALFYEEVFQVGTAGRGFLAAIFGIGNAIGILAGGPLGDRAFVRGPQFLLRVASIALAVCGAGIALFAMAPWLWLAGVLSLVIGVSAGAVLPPLLSSVALVAPPQMRGKAYGLLNMFAIAGVVWVPIAGRIADTMNFRLAILSTVPFLFIGAMLCEGAARSLAPDLRRRMALLVPEAARRSSKGESGLECVEVEAGYNLAPVLQGVSLHVDPGEFVALVGLNGSGKSTLFKAIFGQLPLRGGSVYWRGDRVDHLPTWDRVPLGIAHVPQGRHLFPGLTVDQNLELGTVPIRDDPRRVRRQRELVGEVFPRLAERRDQRAGSMSGGEQQMLAIGRGLMADPSLMLLDEVSLGLSPVMAQEVNEALGRINAMGIAVLIIEHRPWLLEGNTHRVYFLERGQVAWEGGIAEALQLGKVQDFYLGAGEGPAAPGGNGHAVKIHELLGGVKGLGPKRLEVIERHFGDLANVSLESCDELSRIPGLPKAIAADIRKRLEALQ